MSAAQEMDDFPLDEMIDFLKKDDLPDIEMNQEDQLKLPDNSLVNHFMNDPQFWETFLKEDNIMKTSVTKHNPCNYDPILWSSQNYQPTDNYASSHNSSDNSGSSPSHLSEICVTSADNLTQIEENSLFLTNSSPISVDDNSVQLSRSNESPSPTLSNYDSSVSNSIDIGADVIVVTSETYDEDEVITDSDENGETYSISVQEGGLEPLMLSEEEKRLMEKEGVVLPKYLPLTKTEERELKRIRRKIRNKASAQNSRKRKKEYIDGLEKRVKRCTLENNSLKHTLRKMQERNKSLVTELSRLQKLLANSSNKSVQPSTCLMIVLCSFALLLLPNLKPSSMESKDLFDNKKTDQKFPSVRGPSRSLSWTERSQGSPGEINSGFFREENVSNLYEAPSRGSSPKHSDWSFTAGQHKMYPPISEKNVFPEDFMVTGKDYVIETSPPLHSAEESIGLSSPPPCSQEIIISSSPD